MASDLTSTRRHAHPRVRRLCDRVIVMRGGEILEDRPTAALFAAPEHPYTAQLKAAIPLPEVTPGWLGAT